MNTKPFIIASAKFLCVTTGMLALSGCANSENKDALPHASPAKVEQARQDNINRIKNDPNIPEDQKARALQYMEQGANASKPLGATNSAGPAGTL